MDVCINFTLARISLRNLTSLVNRKKNVFTVQLTFLIEKMYLKKKRNNSIFLVTAHFVLSMVTFEAYKRIQVN